MLWNNQEECWIPLDDALCVMEKQYVEIKEENEQLKKDIEKLSEIIDDNIPFDRMLSDRDLNDICNEMGWELSEKGVKLNQLEKENEQLQQEIETLQEQLAHFDIGDDGND